MLRILLTVLALAVAVLFLLGPTDCTIFSYTLHSGRIMDCITCCYAPGWPCQVTCL